MGERPRKTHRRNRVEGARDEGTGVWKKVKDCVGGKKRKEAEEEERTTDTGRGSGCELERRRGRAVVPSIAPSAQLQCHEERGEPSCW